MPRSFYRRGPDHRAGAPVTFLDVRRRFQFRTVEPEELCARAFEAFVQDAACKNEFLVNGTRESEEARVGLYPQGAQRERINRAFQDYFSNLGRALQRKAS